MPTAEEIMAKLKTIFGGNADEVLAAVQDMEARAQVAGLKTKAVDADEWNQLKASVKALEEARTADHILIEAQAKTIETLKGELKAVATSQQAYQLRGEKAIGEVKGLLVSLNAKTDLQEPAQQAQLAAIEQSTKDKVEAAKAPTQSSGDLGLRRTVWGQDGKPQTLAVQ